MKILQKLKNASIACLLLFVPHLGDGENSKRSFHDLFIPQLSGIDEQFKKFSNLILNEDYAELYELADDSFKSKISKDNFPTYGYDLIRQYKLSYMKIIEQKAFFTGVYMQSESKGRVYTQMIIASGTGPGDVYRGQDVPVMEFYDSVYWRFDYDADEWKFMNLPFEVIGLSAHLNHSGVSQEDINISLAESNEARNDESNKDGTSPLEEYIAEFIDATDKENNKQQPVESTSSESSLYMENSELHFAIEQFFELDIPPLDADGRTITINYKDNTVYRIIKETSDKYKLKVTIPNKLKEHKVSMELKDVTWRQIFEVCLQPIDYRYIDSKGSIEILTESEFDELPLRDYRFQLVYVKPSEFVKCFGEGIFDISKGESMSADDNKMVLSVLIHPSKYLIVDEHVERVDTPWGLPRFPSEIFWPKEIPEKIFEANDDWEQQKQLIKNSPIPVDTRVYTLTWVDVRQIAPRIESMILGNEEVRTVQMDLMSNALVVTTSPEILFRLQKVIEFLDDKKWYRKNTE